jgi:hypothetical protein
VKHFLKGKAKYLLLVPILLTIGFMLFFQAAFDEINRTVFNEKLIEKRMGVDMVSLVLDSFYNSNAATNGYDYKLLVTTMTDNADKAYSVFAAVYDNQLNELAEKYNNTVVPNDFEPVYTSAFRSAVKRNISGYVQLPFVQSDGKSNTMYIYYRWISLDNKSGDRILLAVGITTDSVQSWPAGWLAFGMVCQTAISFVMGTALIIVISRQQSKLSGKVVSG